MFGGGIAPMFGKSILGIFTINFFHDSIPGYFGQNAGGGDTEAESIPSDQCCVINRQPLDRQSIN